MTLWISSILLSRSTSDPASTSISSTHSWLGARLAMSEAMAVRVLPAGGAADASSPGGGGDDVTARDCACASEWLTTTSRITRFTAPTAASSRASRKEYEFWNKGTKVLKIRLSFLTLAVFSYLSEQPVDDRSQAVAVKVLLLLLVALLLRKCSRPDIKRNDFGIWQNCHKKCNNYLACLLRLGL